MAGYKIAALILTYNDTTFTYDLCEKCYNLPNHANHNSQHQFNILKIKL